MVPFVNHKKYMMLHGFCPNFVSQSIQKQGFYQPAKQGELGNVREFKIGTIQFQLLNVNACCVES